MSRTNRVCACGLELCQPECGPAEGLCGNKGDKRLVAQDGGQVLEYHKMADKCLNRPAAVIFSGINRAGNYACV
jgi:hypothetical protein